MGIDYSAYVVYGVPVRFVDGHTEDDTTGLTDGSLIQYGNSYSGDTYYLLGECVASADASSLDSFDPNDDDEIVRISAQIERDLAENVGIIELDVEADPETGALPHIDEVRGWYIAGSVW